MIVLNVYFIRGDLMKKVLTIMLGIILSINISFSEVNEFVDVSDTDWFSYDVNQLKSKGFVSGFLDNTFRPNNKISVEEFITITINVIGEKEAIVEKERWSDGFIKKALELEIVLDNEFDDYQRNITRGEMSRCILRASDLSYPENYLEYASMVADIDEMDVYWQDIALKVYTTGLIGGYPNGKFVLDGESTRAEASAILNKILEPDRRSVPLLAVNLYDKRVEYLKGKWNELKPNYFEDPFVQLPSLVSPYSIGKLNELYINDALNMTKFLRILSGLSDDVYSSKLANTDAQHGAVLNAVAGFSHTPPKPIDMSDNFYNRAYGATSSSNLAAGISFLSNAVKYLMEDSDPYNIDRLGHRRWILYPHLNEVGFGYVKSINDWHYYSVMKVFSDLSVVERSYDSVLWPNELAFPVEFMKINTPWSITLNPKIYDRKRISEIKVTLTRVSDNRTWNFDLNDTDKSGKYLNIETNGYGVPFCIIFRPLLEESASYKDGDEYTVNLSGFYTVMGVESELNYGLEYFSLN